MIVLSGHLSLQAHALLQEFAFFLSMQGALAWQNVYSLRNDS